MAPLDFLHSERTQGFAADPDYWKGEGCAFVGSIQNLKDLKDIAPNAQPPLWFLTGRED